MLNEMIDEPTNPEEWAPLRRVTLSEEIADRLISSILNGRFKFGERLPPERDLAKYLGVGRPSIREAMRTLSVIGLVEVRPGEGTFVVDKHSDFLAKAFSWSVLLDAGTAEEVIEARIAIESELAGLAAKRASAADLARLRELLAEMRASHGNPKRFSTADLAFHLALGSAARNQALNRLLHAIQSLLRQWIQRALSLPSAYEAALAQHERVVAAIEAGDDVEARAAMRAHLEEMGRTLVSSLTVGGDTVGTDSATDAPLGV